MDINKFKEDIKYVDGKLLFESYMKGIEHFDPLDEEKCDKIEALKLEILRRMDLAEKTEAFIRRLLYENKKD